MASRSISVELPDAVYNQIKRAAERAGRPIDQVLTEALTVVAPVIDTAPMSLQSALAQLAYLNDAALWQASRATMASEKRVRLQTLHNFQQRRSLTDAERSEEQSLLQLYRETLLVRAQAAVLLKQRDYDVSDPEHVAPLG
ncbi:MAG: hypothetical protein ACRDIY_23785 [Chloroflexota bacterium]